MVAKLLGGQASLFVTRRVMIHNGVVAFRGSTKQADHGGGKRRAAIHFCLPPVGLTGHRPTDQSFVSRPDAS